MMTFIGDVHGNFDAYEKIVMLHDDTLQVGDFGIGFPGWENKQFTWPMRHRFIRGNHDNPEVCRAHPNYLGDYGHLVEGRIFFISGALSIDQQWRLPGFDWWHDEELSVPELEWVYEYYCQYKPDIVVSHMLPQRIQQKIFHFKPEYPCRTSRMLEVMFNQWQPKLWVCGHYHLAKTVKVSGCEFHVLPELGTFHI